MVLTIKNAYTFYNAARVGLAYAEQSMPKVAGYMGDKVQKCILALDLVATCYSVYRLRNKIVQKYDSFSDDNKWKISACVIAGSLGLVVASFLFFKYFNRISTPKINLNEVLKNLPFPHLPVPIISSQQLKNITASWGAPLGHELIQSLFSIQIILNLGLAMLESKSNQPLLDALLQGLTLFKISQLRWIIFERNFFQETKKEGTIEKLQYRCYVRVFSLEIPKLQSTLRSVYEYSSKLFPNSSAAELLFFIMKPH